MKQLFRIFAFIGLFSISIFFLTLSIIQYRTFRKHGRFKGIFAQLSGFEEKLLNIGGIFFLVGLIFFVASAIYNYRFGLN